MFSYIFMKILEYRPERYDTGINILSGGHAKKIRKQIVQTYVKPGQEILDIGCGTGSLIIAAAKTGASATGLDISTGMLAVAQKRIAAVGLQDRITLHNAGVVEIDSLFREHSFDLIISTLVFSELYSEERALALNQIQKLLKPNGTLVIAVEVQPRKSLKQIIHFLVRFPLTVLTYIIAQTGTKPITRISEEISESGLKIISEDRSFLDSFTILAAKKAAADDGADKIVLPATRKPEADISFIKTVWDFIGRWFPNPVEPGLRIIGQPDRNSPVILTSNFHLTVRRVERSLQGENVFLLVAPANGINVWCAACGGELNTHSVITAIKTSRINDRVDHHRIILPQFSAPGIDRQLLKRETSRTGVFGPAHSKNLPPFLKDHKTVFNHNQANFSLLFRLEMLLSMNFVVWIAMGLIAWLIKPAKFLPFSALFWLTGIILYAGFPLIPGKSGWLKAAIISVIEVIAIVVFSVFILQLSSFSHWKIMLIISAINVWFGFDLRGIVAGNPSEAEWLMHKLGMASFGHLFSAGVFSAGKIQMDVNKCNNCRLCLMVCPKSVFAIVDKKDIRINQQQECFACKACVTQCGEEALFLT
ncbi:MAG: methyltransferase domain-containing protein [Candidatus Marinimicrobia bacterium]|nr:methyltransferase domain-containing protein [Candidatus Neomarinimicrobiota bacterium]